MNALGMQRLQNWKIQGERQRVVPERVRIQQEMKRKEEERLRKLAERGAESGVKVAIAA
jgi:hypothetical protein